MRSYESLLTLIAELDGDLVEFERVALRNRKAWERVEGGATDPVDWGALAFTIHTLYGILEGYFLRISKYFENDLAPESWHKALVEKMALDIPGLRPPLLGSPEDKSMVMQVLKFRHRIRNMYGEDLDPRKTSDIQAVTEALIARFPEIHRMFLDRLRAISEALR
jgi:hypothetical protein